MYEFIDKFKNFKSDNTNKEDATIIEDLKEIVNQVSENIESFQFNKSVAKIYEFVNILSDALSKNKLSLKDFEWSLKRLSIILQPFVPHISEEIWSNLEVNNLCINESWIKEDVKKRNILKLAIQINGKTKSIIEIDENLSKDMVLEVVKNNNKIKNSIVGKNIIREIYVPRKIVNLVVQ